MAKTLHLLAPSFFRSGTRKSRRRTNAIIHANQPSAYLSFLKTAQEMARKLEGMGLPLGKTLLKLIDEYNYANFTKHWV